jgi:hypothetical protein
MSPGAKRVFKAWLMKLGSGVGLIMPHPLQSVGFNQQKIAAINQA